MHRNGVILNDYTIPNSDSPTRVFRTGYHSIIDIFITNMDEYVSQAIVFDELSSAHYPVVVEVGVSATSQSQQTRKDFQ